jgi:hypothetical protein
MLAATGMQRLLPAYQVGIGVPHGAAWHNVADILRTGRIPAWLDVVESNVGRRDVATSFFGSWIVAPLVLAPTAGVLVDGVLPRADAAHTYLRAHPGGWFDGIAFGDPGTRWDVPADRTDLHAAWARQTADLATPLLAAVRDAGTGFGLRGLWGNAVVDRILWLATDLAQRGIGDAGAFVAGADELLKALQPLAPVALPAGRTFDVTRPAGAVTFPVKSVCCLLYKTVPRAERTINDYCTGCPLLPDDTRGPRWHRHLESLGREA